MRSYHADLTIAVCDIPLVFTGTQPRCTLSCSYDLHIFLTSCSSSTTSRSQLLSVWCTPLALPSLTTPPALILPKNCPAAANYSQMAEKRPAEGELEGAKVKKRWFVSWTIYLEQDSFTDHRVSFAHATSIITVYTGKERVEYQVHESVLARCLFFRKCLSSGMREQQEKVINLPEDNADDIDIIIKWLYGQKDLEETDILRVASAYGTANKFCLPELENALIDAFRNICATHRLNPGEAMLIWHAASEGCMLRNLLVNQLHHDICNWPGEYKNEGDMVGPYGREYSTLIKEEPQMAQAIFWKMQHQYFLANRNKSSSVPVNPCNRFWCLLSCWHAGVELSMSLYRRSRPRSSSWKDLE